MYDILKETKFVKADLPDQNKLDDAIREQADSIFNSEDARLGRTYGEIVLKVAQGITAEQYLIQVLGFEDAPGKYNDVMKDGIYYEIKAFRQHRLGYKTLWDLARKLKSWKTRPVMNYLANQLLIFEYFEGTYRFYTLIDLEK